MRTVQDDQTNCDQHKSQNTVQPIKSQKFSMDTQIKQQSAEKENAPTQKPVIISNRSKNITKNINITKNKISLRARLQLYNLYGFGINRNKYERKTENISDNIKVEKLQFCNSPKCIENKKNGMKIKFKILNSSGD